MSKVSKEFKLVVRQLTDDQLDKKVRQLRETCAALQQEATYAARELRQRRKMALREVRNGPQGNAHDN